MRHRLAFQPDLSDSVLEDRILMDASSRPAPNLAPLVAMVLTTNGFVVLATTSPDFSSSPGSPGAVGNDGSNGMGIASGFYITGFGLSVMTIGNSTGNPGIGPAVPTGSGNGTGSGPNVSALAGVAGGVPFVPGNPSGQSLPLSPGTGFLFIGRPAGPGFAGSSAMPPDRNGPPGALMPVDPEAPMGPIVPETPGLGEESGTSDESSPSGPGIPAPRSGDPDPPDTSSDLLERLPEIPGDSPDSPGRPADAEPGTNAASLDVRSGSPADGPQADAIGPTVAPLPPAVAGDHRGHRVLDPSVIRLAENAPSSRAQAGHCLRD